MRHRLLPFLAICATLAALSPEPAPARSLLGILTSPLRMLGVRAHRGHHHRYASHYRRFHSAHYARHGGAPHWRYARRSVAPGPAMAGAGAAAAAGATAAAAAAPTPTAASVYWPAAYQDLAGFTFASGTDTGFWNHGFRDVFAGVVVPPDATGAANAQGCAVTNTDAADAAFKQIEDRLTLTPEQRPAFDDLHAAMVRVLARIDAACTPSFANAAPPERMKAISDRLWALRQAMLTLRTPVERAYNAVDDQQGARLDTPGNKVACMGDVAQFPWPRDQIEQVVEPNDQQRAALEMLRQISLQMAQAVASSCPRQALTTPLQRLDAAGDRLNTMLYATMIVGRALGNVYASLSDQQKANFSTIGRALGKNPRAAVVETGAR